MLLHLTVYVSKCCLATDIVNMLATISPSWFWMCTKAKQMVAREAHIHARKKRMSAKLVGAGSYVPTKPTYILDCVHVGSMEKQTLHGAALPKSEQKKVLAIFFGNVVAAHRLRARHKYRYAKS